MPLKSSYLSVTFNPVTGLFPVCPGTNGNLTDRFQRRRRDVSLSAFEFGDVSETLFRIYFFEGGGAFTSLGFFAGLLLMDWPRCGRCFFVNRRSRTVRCPI